MVRVPWSPQVPQYCLPCETNLLFRELVPPVLVPVVSAVPVEPVVVALVVEEVDVEMVVVVDVVVVVGLLVVWPWVEEVPACDAGRH